MYDATTFLQGSKHIIEKSLDSNYFVDKIKVEQGEAGLTDLSCRTAIAKPPSPECQDTRLKVKHWHSSDLSC